MTNWTNEFDLKRLDGLRIGRPHEQGTYEAGKRNAKRDLYAVTPEAKFGLMVADEMMKGHLPKDDSWVARVLPTTAHGHRLPDSQPRPSFGSRFIAGRAREERADGLDERWSAIAQIAATEARRWIATGTVIGASEGREIGAQLQREVRAKAVGDVASGRVPFQPAEMMSSQLDTAASPHMKRVVKFLSMGSEVEAAIDRGAAGHVTSDQEAGTLAQEMRRTMAAARLGVLTPKQIVEAATSPVYAALDDLEPGGRLVVLPTFGRTYPSEERRAAAVTAAMSSPERPVPAEWDRSTTRAAVAAPAPAAAIAAQAARSMGR